MDMDIMRPCRICKGTLIHEQAIQGNPDGGELIIVDTDCKCTNNSYPGFNFIGVISCPINVFHSHEIIETFDATEYSALTDGLKAAISLLLSCNMVDLNDNKLGKVTLWTAFGEESTTVANLITLMAGE